jgi:hypothetical protein
MTDFWRDISLQSRDHFWVSQSVLEPFGTLCRRFSPASYLVDEGVLADAGYEPVLTSSRTRVGTANPATWRQSAHDA